MNLSATRNARTHRRLTSQRWSSLNFDRVNVLGDDASYGHTGCVNTLSWARDGELLLSGGDDRTVRIWRMDPTLLHDYPFVCRGIIHTGHRANIFNAHMLPYSSNIATVAGDGQVRVHGIGEVGSSGPPITSQLVSSHTPIRTFRCHDHRVKKLVTEDSPHLFLTVSEDGSVRQHDLRTPHECDRGSCPSPLIKVDFELSTIALSPLTPFQFLVAGESAYGYLFDRRQAGRFLQEERGMVENGMTHCVRRFGRPDSASHAHGYRDTREHITGARISSQNGHEVSYSADAVYLYSTRDDPEEEEMAPKSHPLPSNLNPDFSKPTFFKRSIDESSSDTDDDTDMDIDDDDDYEHSPFPKREDVSRDAYSGVPLILPRVRFAGARNVDTIKEVNFLGPDDEFVTSGSDDGNFFVWRKDKPYNLQGLLEGDSVVTNVIEGHPHLPLIATSGIDTTVKLFAPVFGTSAFSRMESAERIIASNERQSKISRRVWRSRPL
ncbi:WD40 repeat-like protein [Mycena galericulata]|nr:WD40 repeat-like protein [Mycena galericulata]